MRRTGAGALLAVALAGCSAGPAAVAPPDGPPVSQLRIGLSEYRLQLSAGTLAPGQVEVTVTNAGSAAHDVRLRQDGRVLGATAVLSPGAREVLRLQVSAGRPIALDCTVPGHTEAGMTASLAVATG